MFVVRNVCCALCLSVSVCCELNLSMPYLLCIVFVGAMFVVRSMCRCLFVVRCVYRRLICCELCLSVPGLLCYVCLCYYCCKSRMLVHTTGDFITGNFAVGNFTVQNPRRAEISPRRVFVSKKFPGVNF